MPAKPIPLQSEILCTPFEDEETYEPKGVVVEAAFRTVPEAQVGKGSRARGWLQPS